MALGFVIPPLLVKDGTTDQIGDGLSLMFYIVAGFCSVLFVAVVVGRPYTFNVKFNFKEFHKLCQYKKGFNSEEINKKVNKLRIFS